MHRVWVVLGVLTAASALVFVVWMILYGVSRLTKPRR